MEILARKYEYTYEGADYLIDVGKSFYGNVSGDDHYEYYVDIFENTYKLKPWFTRIFSKEKYNYNCLFEYKTDWVKDYRYAGDIDKVILEAFSKHSKNLKEYKYFTQKEQEWKDSYYNKQKEELYNEFYKKVIADLKQKGLIDKKLFNNIYPWNEDTEYLTIQEVFNCPNDTKFEVIFNDGSKMKHKLIKKCEYLEDAELNEIQYLSSYLLNAKFKRV